MGEYIKFNRKPPAPPEKPKQRISRQRRKRLDKDAEYRAIRDVYLEENSQCANCFADATEVHHIICGVAGRAASLLNTNTWLGLCHECHGDLQGASVLQQYRIKIDDIGRTIERLRK
jgi:hypothetical protein